MSTPTTPSGKALLADLNLNNEHGPLTYDQAAARIAETEQSAFLAGLDSPEMLELLAGALRTVEMTPVSLGPEKDGSLSEFEWQAEAVLASMRSSLRAETPE